MGKQLRKVRQYLLDRLFVRFHLTLMLAAVGLSGVICNRTLFRLFGMHSFSGRYVLSLLISYGMFYVLVGLWLKFIAVHELRILHSHDALPTAEEIDAPDSGEAPQKVERGKGWGFKGDFVAGGFEVVFGSIESLEGAALVGGALFVLGALLAVLGAIYLAGTWFFVEAPLILIDASLCFALGGGLVRPLKSAEVSGWSTKVFLRTLLPLVILLVVALIVGSILDTRCPGAGSVAECHLF